MMIRKHFAISGTVQGVGFRPFIYRIATENNLSGWVLNDSRGVTIEVEGDSERIAAFSTALYDEMAARLEQVIVPAATE